LCSRKSKTFGPLRFGLSKTGVSTSIGGHGLRVTRRADGRLQGAVSAPGSGVRFTETLHSLGPAQDHQPLPAEGAPVYLDLHLDRLPRNRDLRGMTARERQAVLMEWWTLHDATTRPGPWWSIDSPHARNTRAERHAKWRADGIGDHIELTGDLPDGTPQKPTGN
jgi:hypothetical protein